MDEFNESASVPGNNTLSQVPLPKITQEVLLTPEQMKLLASLLPQGYSLVPSTKGSKTNARKSLVKDLVFEERADRLDSHITPKRAIRESNLALRLNSEFGLKCKEILNLLRGHACAGPFLLPVDPVLLGIPDYPNIIKNPMDLNTVGKKLSSNQYSSQLEFEEDISLIWTNAMTYNAPSSPVFKMTEEIKSYYESILRDEQKKLESTVTKKTGARSHNASKYTDFEGNGEGRKKLSSKNVYSERPLTIQEKKVLSQLIRELPPNCLWDVWKIVSPDHHGMSTDEMEFDIDTLPIRTARELESYVKNKTAELNKKKNLMKTNVFYNPVTSVPSQSTMKELSSSVLPTTLPSEVKGVAAEDPDSSFISSLEDDSDY